MDLIRDNYFKKVVAYRKFLWKMDIKSMNWFYDEKDYYFKSDHSIKKIITFRNGYEVEIIFQAFKTKAEIDSNYIMIEISPESIDSDLTHEFDDEQILQEEEENILEKHVKCFVLKNDEEMKEIEIAYDESDVVNSEVIFKIDPDIKSKYSDFNKLNFIFEIKLTFHLERIQLNTSFERLIDKDFLKTFKIICSDEVEILIDPTILVYFSSVFESMFESNLIETRTNQMKLEDIDGKTMKEFVKFLYTSNVDSLDEVVYSLINAAEKYQVSNLKDVCIAFMKDDLSVGNVFETLNVAEMYNVKGLKSQCIDFIALKHDLLKDSIDFESFSNDLKKDILRRKESLILKIDYDKNKILFY